MKFTGQVVAIRSRFEVKTFAGEPVILDAPVDVEVGGRGLSMTVEWVDGAVPVVGSLVDIELAARVAATTEDNDQ